ncbi:MAG: phosphatase [Spirochaetaceae bacterium]|jgi:putative hydrolase|nr:phosphatase [Spirochaetaceae bacterium]
MKIAIDTHTHSTASIHAFSTIDELARGAKKSKLKGFVLTEHGPALQGMPHPFYFGNLKVLPAKLHNVLLFKGVELNIMDDAGNVDLAPKYLRQLDFVMAGFHDACFSPNTIDVNTKAMIAALENPLIDGISHPGNGVFPIYIGEVIAAACKNQKVLEINNSSFKVRRGSNENCRKIACACKEQGALISIGSDAHYWTDVGNFSVAISVVEEAGIEPKNIINSSLENFLEFSAKRKAERSACRSGDSCE